MGCTNHFCKLQPVCKACRQYKQFQIMSIDWDTIAERLCYFFSLQCMERL